MKQLISKILAVFMAFSVVFSTLSFAYSEHFCGDYLVDIALFSKAENCGMAMEVASSDSDCNALKKDCCSDKVEQIEGQSNLKLDFNSFNFKKQQFFIAFTYAYLTSFESIENSALKFIHYTPPLVKKNIAVLYQVFRI